MIIRRLIALLALALATVHPGQAGAQDVPQSSQPVAPPADASPFPPVNGAPSAAPVAPTPFLSGGASPAMRGAFGAPSTSSPSQQDCMKEFVPLREETEKRGKLIKAAYERKAPPDEACKLIASFGQSEVQMIKYVESNGPKCGIPPRIAEQLKAGHKSTEALQQKVCAVAARGDLDPSDLSGASAPRPKNLPVGDFGHWIYRQIP